MRDQYQINGPTENLSVKVEREVVQIIKKMSDYTRLQEGEIVNTALKRFISQHKDFLPATKD